MKFVRLLSECLLKKIYNAKYKKWLLFHLLYFNLVLPKKELLFFYILWWAMHITLGDRFENSNPPRSLRERYPWSKEWMSETSQWSWLIKNLNYLMKTSFSSARHLQILPQLNLVSSLDWPFDKNQRNKKYA